jgi:16S rRNA (guanine527-N7)-methyltransferase
VAQNLSATAKNLQIIFKTHGITLKLTDEMLEQFAKFYKFLMEYNRKYNLTRLHTFNDVAIKHFVDCIYPVQLTEIPNPIVDMGSGAGFPGVPLKIVRPDVRVILVEGVQKKVEYLKELREHLGLKRLDIIGRNVDPTFHYPVKGLTTRAVETAASTLKNAVNSVQVGGRVILLKSQGIDDEIREAEKTMGHVYRLIQNTDYRLGPTTHKRKLLVFEKYRTNPELTKIPDEEV